MVRLARWVAVGLLATPAFAQGLPAYHPVNPFLTSRSGLYFQPYLDRARTWDVRVLTDYASLVEFAEVPGARLVLDAELLRVELAAIRNLGTGFVGVAGSYNGVYPGFMDGFLDWYHDLIGLQVQARQIRPRNEYRYTVDLPDGGRIARARPSDFVGDLRLVAGHRHSSRWQTVATVTLPTGPQGFGRETVSVSAITTVRTPPDRQLVGEFSAGIGYVPTRGALVNFQRTTFHHLSGGARFRFWGRQAVFANVFYQAGNYRATTMRPLDQRELTLDYGFLLRGKRGPEWFLGMTEDLQPKGPAIDLSFRIGARW